MQAERLRDSNTSIVVDVDVAAAAAAAAGTAVCFGLVPDARSRNSVDLPGWDESKLIQQHTHMLQNSCRSCAKLKAR